MATAQRRRRRKNGKTRIVAVIVIAALVACILGTVALVTSCYSKTESDLRRLSYPQKYSEYVSEAARDYHLPEELIYAVIRTESGFDPEAVSPAGAMGLMQLMPSSFEWLMGLRGEEGKYTSENLLDPAVNIDYGAYLLRYFLDYYGGNEEAAVAAYNAGFVVSEWLEDPACSPDGKTLAAIPYPETAAYVNRVEDAKKVYEEIY